MSEKKKSMLFNPATFTGAEYDPKSRQAMLDTVAFFEHKGLAAIREDAKHNVWQDDWMKYQRDHGIFATMLTAEGYGDDPEARFDLYRLCPMSEILAFYGEAYQYPLQVSVLGVGPIWMSDNDEQKRELAQMLKEGGVAAFGMSEKEHGADLYSNEMKLTELGDGAYRADGEKYYIGNAQIAGKISTMGKNATTGEYCNWVVSSEHPNYKYVKDIEVPELGQARVGHYQLIEYPISERDILKTGPQAWDDGLSSINIGKFQVGFAACGIAAHSFYEAITHANNRIIYGKPVTNFPHIRAFLSEAFCRANAMKLYALRSRDYFRVMGPEDRRYLLFNPIQKMKVTTEGGDVLRLLMDVVCAKGYETENFLSNAYATADMLFRLEGTAHVNMSLVLKFMQNYLFNPVEYPTIGIVDEMKDDNNIFNQTTGGLAKVRFPDCFAAYEGVNLPNVNRFKEQISVFRELIGNECPDDSLRKNMDYMLNYGEIFTMIVYAQLVLEGAKLNNVADDLIDQIFKLFVKDVNRYALNQVNNHKNTPGQDELLRKLALMGPVVDPEGDFKFWQEYVQSQDGAYAMTDAAIGVE